MVYAHYSRNSDIAVAPEQVLESRPRVDTKAVQMRV